MLKRKFRFSFRKGIPKHTISNQLFTMRYERNSQMRLQIAVVVGKRVDRKAVVRNTLKRRTSTLLRELISDFSVPYSVVLYMKKNAMNVKAKELESELKKAFVTVKILT